MDDDDDDDDDDASIALQNRVSCTAAKGKIYSVCRCLK
jgi:hypothetical protein